jgi:hypothetical protein
MGFIGQWSSRSPIKGKKQGRRRSALSAYKFFSFASFVVIFFGLS